MRLNRTSSKANHTSRVRYQVSSVAPLNYSNECSKLADLIKLYNIA